MVVRNHTICTDHIRIGTNFVWLLACIIPAHRYMHPSHSRAVLGDANRRWWNLRRKNTELGRS